MTKIINIPKDKFRDAMRILKAKSLQEAAEKAFDRCLATLALHQRDLIPIFGTFENFMTPEELERTRSEK